MHHKQFIEQLDDGEIAEAIGFAEMGTSGEIRVFVSHKRKGDALAEAREHFFKLGMDKTPLRNAVLVYFAPTAQKFAVWGDTGAHEKCGDAFWKTIAGRITPFLKEGKFTEAIVEAVEDIGDELAKHFPRKPGDGGKFSDAVVRE